MVVNISLAISQRNKRRKHISEVWRGLRALIITVAMFLTATSGDAQQQVGYVLDATGNWFLAGKPSKNISKGSTLPAGGEIYTTSPREKSSYITIVDRNGNFIEKKQCSNPGECDRRIRLPKSVAQETALTSRIAGAAMALLSRELPKYESFISRSAELQEAVVKLSDGEVELSPVFKNIQRGRYLLRFEQISRKDAQRAATPLTPFPFDWDPNNPSSLVTSGLTPGLYKLALFEEQGRQYEPTGTEGWVLISEPGKYEMATSSFQNAVAVTKQWSTKVKQNVIREFLRASLEYIAAQ